MTWRWHASGIVVWQGNMGLTTYTNTRIYSNRVDNFYHDGIKSDSNASIFGNEVSTIQGSAHSDSLLIQSGSYSAIYNNFVHDSGDQNIYLDNLNQPGVNG